MFLRRFLVKQADIYRKCVLSNGSLPTNIVKYVNYSGIVPTCCHKYTCIPCKETRVSFRHPSEKFLIKRYKSDGALNNDPLHENELKKITELFPEPRVTLNILTTRTPEKVFDIHYKQQVVAPKGRKKSKEKSNNEWICTYAFIWPEKIKFEGSAISKRQAAEKAAIQALHYLYINRRIDKSGKPIFDREVLDELKSTLNQPLSASLGENSIGKIEKIWSDYENGIKDIYERTFKESSIKVNSLQTVLSKDSTIDNEDGSPEEENELDSEVTDSSEEKVLVHPVYGRPVRPPTQASIQKRSRILKTKLEAYRREMEPPLPIDQYVDDITTAIQQHPVTIVVGAAGCGKSTRLPGAILEKCGVHCEAVVSEPRRVAAIDLAERVAAELGEDVGESVGYTVRLRAQPPRPPGGAILFCTSGVLLRRLQSNPGLEGCSHVIIDEAHERDVNTDVTLLLLKRALNINPRLKVVVMSATLDIDAFTRYFGSCPVVEVPGRAYPVEVSYLEEIQSKLNVRLPLSKENCTREDGRPNVHCQEIAEVVKAVDKTQPEGAILVFLPGWAEIKRTKTLLDEQFGDSSTHLILPVHSRLSTTEQTKMFAKPLPGVRKIVLATNVAETSITIPDVVYVIDSGAHKENRIVEGSGTASLETVWVSMASAKQRAGRAGRVQPGHCFRMYTKEKEGDFVSHTMPEILRIPLDQTVLECKAYAPDDKIEDFLSELPEPPSKKAIKFAINDLIDLGALTPTERLTPLGCRLTRLPLPPRAALCLLHGAACGNLLSAAHAAAHVTAAPDLFDNAPDRRAELREIKRKYSPTSDHAALHCIQEEFSETLANEGWSGVNQWCERRGIRKDRLWFVRSLSNLYISNLLKSGIVEPTIEVDELNRFSDIDELTAAVLLSGSNALLKTKRQIRTKGKLKTSVDLITSTGERAHIGSESVNHGITKQKHNQNCLLTYYSGHHSVERRALVVYKTSVVSPHTAILFSKGEIRKGGSSDCETTVLSLPKHKLEIHVPTSQVDKLLKTREMLWNTLQYYLERDIRTLDYDENTLISRFRTRLIKIVCRVLVEAQKEIVQDIQQDVR